MKHIFIISGYGVPRDIFKDDNYNFYLKICFNRIYDIVVAGKFKKPLIIFTGGPTDMIKPYKRTEAGEMKRFFIQLASRPALQQKTEDWQLITESKSITGLENFLFCLKLIKSKRVNKASIYFFCERLRAERNKKIASKVFKKPFRIAIEPIDFDVSANRYLDPKFIQQKEGKMLEMELWALKSKTNLKKYHHAYAERLKYLRQAGPKKHVEVVNKWWQEKLDDLYALTKKY